MSSVNTDLYAFVSPDRPDTVTVISTCAQPHEPGDDVRHEIHIDNDGDAVPDITYRFHCRRRQVYSVTKVVEGEQPTLLADGVPDAPATRSTGETLATGERVYAGRRADGFYVDLGSVFDLPDLRPFRNQHLAAHGRNPMRDVHAIAIQVPVTDVTRDGRRPRDPADPAATIGVYASASRPALPTRGHAGHRSAGAYTQASRRGNPLFHEVIVPSGLEDEWNRAQPRLDKQYLELVERPEVAARLPVLFPGVFPNLAALTADRADLVALLLTGIPAGVIPGFQNLTGPTPADLLRLNVAIPPAAEPRVFGLLGGDPAGFPNGRRVFDDVVAIELRALAGATYPLVDPTFTPDAPAAVIDDGVKPRDLVPSLETFPYLGAPSSGYDAPAA
jgi:hypothetical protein